MVRLAVALWLVELRPLGHVAQRQMAPAVSATPAAELEGAPTTRCALELAVPLEDADARRR